MASAPTTSWVEVPTLSGPGSLLPPGPGDPGRPVQPEDPDRAVVCAGATTIAVGLLVLSLTQRRTAVRIHRARPGCRPCRAGVVLPGGTRQAARISGAGDCRADSTQLPDHAGRWPGLQQQRPCQRNGSCPGLLSGSVVNDLHDRAGSARSAASGVRAKRKTRVIVASLEDQQTARDTGRLSASACRRRWRRPAHQGARGPSPRIRPRRHRHDRADHDPRGRQGHRTLDLSRRPLPDATHAGRGADSRGSAHEELKVDRRLDKPLAVSRETASGESALEARNCSYG